MKILISTDTYYPQVNGASYFTQRLARDLQAHGHEVVVIAPSQSLTDTDTVIHNIRVIGIHSFPILFYPSFRFCLLLFKNKFIQKIIEDFKPDIIHFQGHFAISRKVLALAQEKHIPVVATNHFMPENLIHYVPFHSVLGELVKKIAWKDFSKVFSHMGAITTPTQIAADLIQSHFSQKIIPISCGINLTTFNPKNDGAYLKKRYGIGNIPTLLYVGRLDKEKNLDMVLNACALALQKSSFQLVVAGSGAEKTALMTLSKTLGIEKNVIFTGFVPNEDLPNLYTTADCFIIAGTAELQSIVTMEAMASGLPVLAINAVALPELVQDGENGFLFEPNDISGLSEKMTRIFSDEHLRKNMADKSLSLISRHAIDTSIQKFEALYRTQITSSK